MVKARRRNSRSTFGQSVHKHVVERGLSCLADSDPEVRNGDRAPLEIEVQSLQGFADLDVTYLFVGVMLETLPESDEILVSLSRVGTDAEIGRTTGAPREEDLISNEEFTDQIDVRVADAFRPWRSPGAVVTTRRCDSPRG